MWPLFRPSFNIIFESNEEKNNNLNMSIVVKNSPMVFEFESDFCVYYTMSLQTNLKSRGRGD